MKYKTIMWDLLITARKRSLRRLCFYRCLSFCPQGGHAGLLQGGWGHAWLLLGGCVVALGGGMHGCSGGGHAWLLPGGACMVAPGGHVWLLWGGCVWLLLGGMRGCSGGVVRGFFNEIRSMSGRYASYWNAFLSIRSVFVEGWWLICMIIYTDTFLLCRKKESEVI